MPLKLLKQLESKLEQLNFKNTAKDAHPVLERCENTHKVYEAVKSQLEQLAPTIEQMKGMVKGLELSQKIVAQHKEILKVKAQNEEIDKQEFIEKAALIDKCTLSLKESEQDRKFELLRLAGKGDGLYISADSALSQIESYLTHLKSQKQFMDDNPDLFTEEELVVSEKTTKNKKANTKGSN